jgi:hypothetical protein
MISSKGVCPVLCANACAEPSAPARTPETPKAKETARVEQKQAMVRLAREAGSPWIENIEYSSCIFCGSWAALLLIIITVVAS